MTVPLVRVEDSKVLAETDERSMLTKKASAKSVKGSHLELLGAWLAYELCEALPHLVRRLVRECDGANGPWWYLVH